MWKLPDGRVISVPKNISIGNVNYPAQIFRRWTKEELNAHGIYPYREVRFDREFYVGVNPTEEIVDGEMVITWGTVPRYTIPEVRKVFAAIIKDNLRSRWKFAKEELEYLEEFDTNNTGDISTWQQYMLDLKQSAQNIKAAFQALSSYEEGIEFIKHGYAAMLPAVPLQEEIT